MKAVMEMLRSLKTRNGKNPEWRPINMRIFTSMMAFSRKARSSESQKWDRTSISI
jgi:hypothetical protein